MIANIHLLLAGALFITLLATLIGFIVAIFFDNWIVTQRLNRISSKLIEKSITLVITILVTILVFWINVKLSGVISWSTQQVHVDNSSVNNTIDYVDS
jgi:hypothetical protein